MQFPPIIQGGMGISVSGWPLARAVAQLGQVGVVSGTALDVIFARRLQQGDPDGHLRRALDHFPIKAVAQRVFDRYFTPNGKAVDAPFKMSPVHTVEPNKALIELTVVANFVEVFLAKEGHDGLIGINYLEKIQLPTLPSLLGAMLAGVNIVLMGAGIPRSIPGIMDKLAVGEAVEMRLDVEQAGEHSFFTYLDPKEIFDGPVPAMNRPHFFAIISSTLLAQTLARKATGKVDGFIIEGSTAGGHNAPPRGTTEYDANGEPIYGPRDIPDIPQIAAIGLPFWMAGTYGTPEKLAEARAMGAQGIQVGTAFAFCEESGMLPEFKRMAIEMSRAGTASVYTDPLISPTGFPFKILNLPGTIADPAVYQARTRVCDAGFLKHTYLKEDGTIGYRCPAEPVEQYLKKGGSIEDTVGRGCVCNGLSATVGLPQVRNGGCYVEEAMITAGNDAVNVERYVKPGETSYTAADVIKYLLS